MEIKYERNNPFNKKYEDLGTIYLDNGERVFPKTEAFLAGTNEEPLYVAYAVSEEKGEDGEPITDFRVTWKVIDGWESIEDAENHCDWDEFEVVEA